MSAVEQATSRTVNYESGNPVGMRTYYCYPYDTEKDVQNIIGTLMPGKFEPWPTGSVGTPPVYLILRDWTITRDPNVEGGWHVNLMYRDGTGETLKAGLQPNDDNYVSIRLSSEARLVDAWRQWVTQAEFDSVILAKTSQEIRPLYRPGIEASDIGGRKIDVAGYPTSVLRPVQRMIVDITTTRFPQLRYLRYYLGTRNNANFLNMDAYTAVFTGGEASQMQPGRWIVSLNFDVDQQYHLQQVVARNASGYAQTDAGGETTALTTGQAAIVSWVQPYPLTSNFRMIHPALANL